MQIIESNNGLLTNIEVFDLLQERKQQRLHQISHSTDRQRIDSQHRLAIENKTLQYFENNKLNEYSLQDLSSYLLAIKESGMKLNENEIIQLVNLLPQNDVEFYLILEDCSERFTENEILSLKQFVETLQERRKTQHDIGERKEQDPFEPIDENILITTTVKTVEPSEDTSIK